MFRKIIAVGDCNTLGANELAKKSYPEKTAQRIGAEVVNQGYTMATTREGISLLRDGLDSSADCVFIQFGLVDSYKTFKYSPYVLYYPDNFLRKQLRSVIKKYKKTCRKLGLNRRLGEKNVVPSDEYEGNIRTMVQLALPRKVFLIDTVPNRELWRNPEIQRYNEILDTVCRDYKECVKVKLYSKFETRMQEYYMDATHCNADGYQCITEELISAITKL